MYKSTIFFILLSASVGANQECPRTQLGFNDEVSNTISSTFAKPLTQSLNQVQTKWEITKSFLSCPEGRLKEKKFNIEDTDEKLLSGYLTDGYDPGEVFSAAIGKSSNNDLVLITKTKNKEGKIVANVTISLCKYSIYDIEYISDNAGLSNFYVKGLVFESCSEDSGEKDCLDKNILAGQIGFFSSEYGGNVPISFSRIFY